jgi:hypothetical protein
LKRLFIILLVLCPYLSYGHLQAQIYSTSSATHHSYSTGGTVVAPSPVEFRSTSTYNSSSTYSSRYSTAPMQIANGTVKTVASSIQGGVLSDKTNSSTGPQRIRGRQNTMAPPTETAPIGDGWDVALLLTLLCAGYAVYCYKKNKKKMA